MKKEEELTKREKQIAALVAQDKKPKEVAEKLEIAKRTVYTHLDNISKKLDLDTRKTKDVADAVKDKK